MMSTDGGKSSDDVMCCASCGIAGVDDVKLMECDGGCDLVKYCSDACQKIHREQHEEECKKDKMLFTQPDESYMGECPICCLPLSIDESKSTIMPCCCKIICNGCQYANKRREDEAGLENRCAFCREPLAKSKEAQKKNMMERVKKNDPDAMRFMGRNCIDKRDYETAFEYLTKAAELGNAGAHHYLSTMYFNGEGVEKDMEKAVHHWEEAAIGGHPFARHNLGIYEANNGRFERAAKHFIINANLEFNDSLKLIKKLYAEGHASKEEYATALRGYQAAVEATKSTEREKAEPYYKDKKSGF